MKKVLSLILALLMTFSLAACGGSEQRSSSGTDDDTAAATDNILRLAINDAATLSPLGASENESILMGFSQGTLYKKFPAADGMGTQLLPDLAVGEPVDVNGDGLVWNIAISPDAKWHNGDPITAETFEFSMKMALDPVLSAAQAELLANNDITIKNAFSYYTAKLSDWSQVGIKAIDGNVLQITTGQTCHADDVMRHFSTYWTSPVHEEIYTAGTSDDGTSTTYGSSMKLTGYSGPYFVKSRVPGFYMRLERNPNYLHAENYHFDQVMMSVSGNTAAAVQRLERGEFDYITLSPAHAGQLAEDPRVIAVPTRCVRMIDFCDVNTKNPILANENFRKAVYYGIDRQELAALMNGRSAPYVVPHAVQTGSTGAAFRDLPEAAAYLPENNGYDPDAAGVYLEKALKEEGLSAVTVKLLYSSTGDDRIIAGYLREQFAALFGDKLKLDLDPVPESLYLSTVGEWKSDPNAYEMALTCTDLASWDNDPTKVFGVHTTDYANRAGDSPRHSKTINELFALSELSENRMDSQKLTELAMEMEKVFIEEVVAVPVVEDVGYVMCSGRLELPLKVADPALGCGIHFARFIR